MGRGCPRPVAGRSLRASLPILFGTADAGQADPRLALLGSAHTLSPDARYGHPDLRSLGGVCALALRASLVSYAAERDTGDPEPDGANPP